VNKVYMPNIDNLSVVELKDLLERASKKKISKKIISKIKNRLGYMQEKNKEFIDKWFDSPQMELGITMLIKKGEVSSHKLGDVVYYHIDELVAMKALVEYHKVIQKLGEPINEELKEMLHTYVKGTDE